MATASSSPRRYVILGGGIAGVTAAEELLDLADSDADSDADGPPIEVTLLTATRVVKRVGRVVQVTRRLEEVEVEERDADEYGRGRPNLRIVQARVVGLDPVAHVVRCEDGSNVPYDRCLVCTGAAPKLVSRHPNVVGIRDTESVQELSRRLASARRVVVVGNGGIALEVVHEVAGVELVWAVKDGYVGNTFFDHTASGFVLPELRKRREVRVVDGDDRGGGATAASTSTSASASTAAASSSSSAATAAAATTAAPVVVQEGTGGALGPDWTEGIRGGSEGTAATEGSSKPLTILFHAELAALVDEAGEGGVGEGGGKEGWPLYVRLTNGQTWGCDFVVSATGVVPVVGFLGPEFARGKDGGVVVNDRMQTTGSPDVFAAGDCCAMTWPESDVWFQMRLWTQARTMARYAARCMADKVDELGAGFAFELFAHATRFFGFKVALLGCFNAQHLPDPEQRRLVQEVKVTQTITGDLQQQEETVRLDGPAASLPSSSSFSSSEAPADLRKAKVNVEVLTRLTPGLEYLKVVVVDGRVKGAMLVGEGTEMAETFENLILNQIDVSPYGVDLLNPEIDVDDYFD